MKKGYIFTAVVSAAVVFAACSDKDTPNVPGGETSELPDWYYAGGKLGTSYITTSAAFEQPTASVENSGMMASFKRGEQLFEKNYVSNSEGVRSGLGPTYIRSSCMHCHPGYGHGKSQPDGAFRTNEAGNGYLLVVYNPATQGYVNWLAGMPQGHAVAPFKAPLDEDQVTIKWHEYTDATGNRFDDGETYSLRYPEVTMPPTAVYAYRQGVLSAEQMGDYEVKLESTIGIYGTGLLDAIPTQTFWPSMPKRKLTVICPTALIRRYSARVTGKASTHRRKRRQTSRNIRSATHMPFRAVLCRMRPEPTPTGTSPT